ncbi:MAG: AMP-dependent synthetase, partial [Syntrophaceae bacterium]|nr:AMP-dependent synthetase [Syntrophaceae bacterium]
AEGYIKIVDRKAGLMVLDTGKNVPSAKIESQFSLSKYIDILIPLGDNRKYVTAIIVPNFDACIDYLDKNSISYDEEALVFAGSGSTRVCIEVGDDFIEKEELRKRIDDDIKIANEELEEFERIQKYLIIRRKMTEETGEITPTLKIKRNIVLKNFEKEIERMYSGK